MNHCLLSSPPKPAAPTFQIAASSKQTQLITGPLLAVGSPCFNRTAVMGYEHVEIALESDRYDGIEKAVIVALCHFINNKRSKEDDTVVWPGMKTLCRIAGWSYTTVQRAIDKVVADSSPAVEIVSVGKGKESIRYQVHLDRLGGSAAGITAQPTVEGGSGKPIPVVGKSLHGGSSEPTGVVAESYPNQEENPESTKKEKQKAKASALASASILSDEDYLTLNYIYRLVSGNKPTDAERKLLFGFPIQDPVLFAHQMIWAYKVSANYELNGLRSFLAALPRIEKSYEAYHAKLRDGKVRPEIAILDLPHIEDYAEGLDSNRVAP